MILGSLKIWRYIAVGALAGLVVGWSRTQMLSENLRSMSQSEFELKVKQEPEDGLPMLADVRVRPGSDGGYIVTGKQLFAMGGQYAYEPFEFDAPDSIVPQRVAAGTTALANTFLEFLSKASQRNPDFKYEYSWWAGPHGIMLMFAGGGAALIGIIWPIAMRLMIAGGLGGKKPKESFDISRFGKNNKGVTPPKPAIASEQSKQLDVLLGHLQRADKPAEAVVSTPAVEMKADEPAIRALTGGTVAPVPTEIPKDDTHFGGVFYPTAAHGDEGNALGESLNGKSAAAK